MCIRDRDRSQIIEGGIFISRVRSHALETAVDAIMNKINNYELLSGDVVSDAEDVYKRQRLLRFPLFCSAS